MTLKRAFPPVANAQTRVLVLGSLPGEMSLAAGRYYAHPQNALWRLVGHVLDEDIAALPYEDRLATLRERGVGLWDVIGEANRRGSLDADIQDATANDLATLIQTLPRLRAVAFNGATAAKLGGKLLAPFADRLALLPLPSSSPAHAARSFTEKAALWRALRDWLD